MKTETPKTWPPKSLAYLGLCPECAQAGERKTGTRVDGLIDGIFEKMPYLWMTCSKHRLKWPLKDWFRTSLTTKELEANTKLLQTYRTVEPHLPRKNGRGPVTSRTRA